MMRSPFESDHKKNLLRHTGKRGLVVQTPAHEVSILNNRGQLIWQKRKDEKPGPIQWDGVDLEGHTVEVGEYVCKILYPDGKTLYVPFVFLK
jgi:hypothetical protein